MGIKKKYKPHKTPIQKSKVKKKKGKEETVALIDMEIILYNVCCDCLREHRNSKDEYYYTVSKKDAQDLLDDRIKQVLLETKSDRCVLYFGSITNYRKKIDPDYKAHRTSKKPLGYRDLEEWLKESYATQERPHLEADDLIGIIHTRKIKGITTIAISSDKDFKCLPGLLYNPSRPEDGIVNITEDQANDWHIYQTLVGDTADGYKGCPKVGDVGASKLLENKKLDYKEKWIEVIKLFKAVELSKSHVLIQARLARICRKENYDMESGELTLWNLPKIRKA